MTCCAGTSPTISCCAPPVRMRRRDCSTWRGFPICWPASKARSCTATSTMYRRSPCRSCLKSAANRSKAKRATRFWPKPPPLSKRKPVLPEATSCERPEDYGVEPGALALMSVEALADPSGALFLTAERALIVADLHLEKGSSFARRGVLLPPYDTATTLLFLARAVARWRPRLIVALGDSFHDVGGPARLDAQSLDNLRE